ncbi:MAG: pyruvate formate lyase family protein [Thermodesulfobacteriota bacterium]|nr:pyruvate formate lyase family protein [Thermodesulfobacteriota bacterium]
MTARTQMLKDNVIIKTHRNVARGLEKEEEGIPFRPEMAVKLCLDRARLLTDSYKKTEGEPMVLRRAKGLARILEGMNLFIQPNELIVGNFAGRPECVTHYPDLQWRWVEKAVHNGYRDILSDEEREELSQIHEYWKTRAVHGKERDLLPEDIKPYWSFNGVLYWAYQWAMSTPNYEKLFRLGIKGIRKEAEEKLNGISKDFSTMAISGKDYIEKKGFLEAVIITLDAFTGWALRYSKLAGNMVLSEEDSRRKEELRKINKVSAWVSENPPRTLYEALQLFWFIHVIIDYIEVPLVGCGIRFDQAFYPFYEKDFNEGRITRDGAQELVECLWLKFQETGFLHPPIWSGAGGGGLGWQTLTIGGVDSDGQDVTNEMSYIVLDAVKSTRTIQPPLALRWHDTIPRELVLKAIEVISTGVAQPAIFNDNVVIPRYLEMGVSREEAQTYSINNCMFPILPGKNITTRTNTAGLLFLPKCLELALNQGKDMKTGQLMSCETPDPSTFSSVEDLMDAVIQHYGFYCHKAFHISDIGDALYEEYLPRPFLSALLDGCIERAEDLRKWNYLPWKTLGLIGAINVADALAAVKKFVFEEKKLTMPDLIDILRKNWEGKEDVRMMFLNEAPKFGNDEDYVDLLARDLYYKLAQETKKYKTYYGTPGFIDGSVASAPYSFAVRTWATPDGRKAGDPFHDGSITPESGMDRNGPTAALNSISKIDPLKSWNHLYNQSFMPQFLQGENAELFADYLKTWGDLGIHHIQFTVVDKETMLDAQKKPENYADLIVRVCGYSAYFVDLSKGLQDEIIKRTEQHL